MLSVAGLRLRIGSPGRRVREPDDAVYADFVGPTGAGPADIDITLVPGAPAAAPGPLVFDTGVAWSLHREPAGFRLAFRSGPDGADDLQLVCDEGFDRVTAFVDEVAPEVRSIPSPLRYPVDQLVLLHHLALRGGVIVHAAGVVLEGRAYALCGVSGAGKTTVARAFIAAGLGERLLSDDRLIVRRSPEGGYLAWGTPWPGDARVARNAGAPLAALVFLAQEPAAGATCRLVPLAADEALQRLLPVVSCPWYDERRAGEVLDTCGALVMGHPCLELRSGLDAPLVDALHALADDLAAP